MVVPGLNSSLSHKPVRSEPSVATTMVAGFGEREPCTAARGMGWGVQRKGIGQGIKATVYTVLGLSEEFCHRTK